MRSGRLRLTVAARAACACYGLQMRLALEEKAGYEKKIVNRSPQARGPTHQISVEMPVIGLAAVTMHTRTHTHSNSVCKWRAAAAAAAASVCCFDSM